MLLGFKKRFREPILIGTKVFTLRKKPKRMPKLGETLYMYSGLRSQHCEFISDKETLRGIQDARVLIKKTVRLKDHFTPTENYYWWYQPNEKTGHTYYGIKISIDRRDLTTDEIEQFVKYDGFKDVYDFCEFWLTSDKGKKLTRVGASLKQFHWTDLKY